MPNQVEFAIFSPQVGISWSALLDRAQSCEKLGFHPISPPAHAALVMISNSELGCTFQLLSEDS